jgi:flagellar biosynthesis protein FlhF
MKSYFASSFQLAMEQARRELGPDAVLISDRPAPPEARHLGEFEAVFATDAPPATAPATGARPSAQPVAPSPSRPEASAVSDSILSELRDLRRQFQSWRQVSLNNTDHPRWILSDPELNEIYSLLLQTDVDRELALKIVSNVQTRRDRGEAMRPADIWSTVEDEIGSLFDADPTPGEAAENGPMMLALVGPPGAGKTATIAKLAVRYGLALRKPGVLISVDNLRVGASEQLRWYASLLGMGFHVVETGRALAQAIEEYRNKGAILIDTPGLSFNDLKGGSDIADYLARNHDIRKHLVLPASMRATEMKRYSIAYDIFRPSHLIFTRLDETAALGPILGETVRSGRPISFLGTGQRVPEDLEPGAKATLICELCRTLKRQARVWPYPSVVSPVLASAAAHYREKSTRESARRSGVWPSLP